MKLVLYFKRGCPFCQKVKEKLEGKDLDVKIYYVGEDFSVEEYKKKYGDDATFPRGFVVEGKHNHLLKDSSAIIEFIENEFETDEKEEKKEEEMESDEEKKEE